MGISPRARLKTHQPLCAEAGLLQNEPHVVGLYGGLAAMVHVESESPSPTSWPFASFRHPIGPSAFAFVCLLTARRFFPRQRALVSQRYQWFEIGCSRHD